MKRFFCVLAACVLLLSGCGSSGESSAQIFAMDTVMQLSAFGRNSQTAVDQAEQLITELESLLSRTEADSQVSSINQHAGEAVSVSPEVFRRRQNWMPC